MIRIYKSGQWINISGKTKDELSFSPKAQFPATGDEKTIYVATDENKVYRWDSTTHAYIAVGGGSGAGAVESVNGKTGAVVLSANDINATNSQSIQANLERIDEEINRVEDKVDAIKKDALTKVDTTEYPTIEDFLESEGEEGIIYLYPLDTSDPTKGYYRFIWEDEEWLDLGTTEIDLFNYYDKDDADALFNQKQNRVAITSASDITIGGLAVPSMSVEQVESAYNHLVAGDTVIVSSTDGEKHFIPFLADSLSDIPAIHFFYYELVITYWVEAGSVHNEYYEIAKKEDLANFFTKTQSDERYERKEDFFKIFGVRFYGSSTTGVRLYDALNMRANVGYVGETPINDFDNAPIYRDIKTIEYEARSSNGTILLDENGNAIKNRMVKIPNFYFKFNKGIDETGDYDEFLISNKEQYGFSRIFGNDKQYALVGAYFTTPLSNNNSNTYGSVSGQNPRVNVSQYGINANMSYIRVDGVDKQLNSSESKLVWDAISYLMLIEFADRNVQNILQGVNGESWTNPVTDATVGTYNAGKTTNQIVVSTSKSEAKGVRVSIFGLSGVSTNTWKEINVVSKSADTPSAGLTTLTLDETITFPASGTVIICCSSGGKVGKTNALTCSSGYELTRADSLPNNIRHMRYRGIEDAFGGLWNILCDYAYRITYDSESGTYTRETIARGESGDKTSPNNWGVLAGTNWSNNDGYVKSINVVNGTIVVEVTTGASSATYYCDYHYRDAPTVALNYRCFIAGGGGHYGAHVGPFCFNCNDGFASSNYYSAVRSFTFV